VKLWDRVWHQPVSAARPYLLTKVFLFVLALDAWVLMAPRAALYGSAGFNVAHFRILEWLQPAPSSAVYIAIMLLTGMLALVIALSGFSRMAMAALFALYTYGWAMSLLDSYQHHYFISLVLFCLLFFPRAPQCGEDRTRQRKWQAVDAWAYKMLGVTIAIMYFYAAISKLDRAWRSGETLRHIVGDSGSLHGMFELLSSIGVEGRSFWATSAAAVIAAELLIAAGYVFAAFTDGRASGFRRGLGPVFFALAVGLHAGIELVEMQIGWFSYYMLLLGGVYFLPLKWIEFVAELVARGDNLVSRIARFCTDETPNFGLTTLLLGANLAAFALTIDLPGAAIAGVVLAVLVLALVAGSLLESRKSVARLRIFAVAVAVLVMWAAIIVRPVRFEFYLNQGQDLQQRGQPKQALSKYERAQQYTFGANESQRAQLYQQTGLARWKLGQHDEAVTNLRRAMQLAPSAESSYNLARSLVADGRVEEAVAAYRRAISIDDEFAEAHNNLALLLADKGDSAGAELHWRAAIRARPDLAQPYNNLGNLYFQQAAQAQTEPQQDEAYDQARQFYKRATDVDAYYVEPLVNLGLLTFQQKRPHEAERHFRAALQLAPHHRSALFHVGLILDARGESDTAATWYRKAIRTHPDFAEAHFELGGVLESKGELAAAAEAYGEAIRIDPQFEDAKRGFKRVREQLD